MAHSKNIVIIAGEQSGDNIGSVIASQIQKQFPDYNFYGITGPKMEASGIQPIFSIDQIAIMGFIEIIPKIPKILRLIKLTVDEMIKLKPEIVISIDAPDFAFRVIKKYKKFYETAKNTKFIHIVAPSVWAYRAGRAKQIAKLIDHLLCYLPFEPPYFTQHGLKADFIGHPIVELLLPYKKNMVRDQNLIFAMPGSRLNEVKKLWPLYIEVFRELYKKFPNLQIAIPTTLYLKDYLLNNSPKDLNLIFTTEENEKFRLYNTAKVALIKSGTSSLEAAIFNCPMVVTYKVNKITAIIARKLLKIKYVSLINIIANDSIIPELIQENATTEKITKALIEQINSDRDLDYSEIVNKINKPTIKTTTNIISEYIYNNART